MAVVGSESSPPRMILQNLFQAGVRGPSDHSALISIPRSPTLRGRCVFGFMARSPHRASTPKASGGLSADPSVNLQFLPVAAGAATDLSGRDGQRVVTVSLMS